jgi:hypothetical protein
MLKHRISKPKAAFVEQSKENYFIENLLNKPISLSLNPCGLGI